jgi:uncharacterized Zn finger protein (UPF0148 family)
VAHGYGYESFLCDNCGSPLFTPGERCPRCGELVTPPTANEREGHRAADEAHRARLEAEARARAEQAGKWRLPPTPEALARLAALPNMPIARISRRGDKKRGKRGARKKAAQAARSGSQQPAVSIPTRAQLGRERLLGRPTFVIEGQRGSVMQAVHGAREAGLSPVVVRGSVRDTTVPWVAHLPLSYPSKMLVQELRRLGWTDPPNAGDHA